MARVRASEKMADGLTRIERNGAKDSGRDGGEVKSERVRGQSAR